MADQNFDYVSTILEVSGFAKREVLMVNYSFNKATDVEGQVTGRPRGGKITIRVKASEDGNPELMSWCVSTAAKNGKILFKDAEFKKMKEIEFSGASCVEYSEHRESQTVGQSNSNTGLAHYEEIVISCKQIKNGNVSYVNWNN